MTQLEKAPARPLIHPTPIVRVTQMGGDTLPLDFRVGQTTGDYLAQAGIQPGHGEVVTINGRPADLKTPVEAGSVVVVASKVVNGR